LSFSAGRHSPAATNIGHCNKDTTKLQPKKKKKLRFDFFVFFFSSSLGSADCFVMPFSLSLSLSMEVCIFSKQGRNYFFLSDERKTDAPMDTPESRYTKRTKPKTRT
jgi:hypothetical protein